MNNRLLLLLTLGVFLLSSCSLSPPPPKGPVKKSIILMDTLVEIAAYGPRDKTEKAVKEAIEEMKRLDALFDRHKEKSFAKLFDKGAGKEPLQSPPEFIQLLEATDKLVKATNGAFDPTVAPLLDSYRFDVEKPYIPSDNEVNTHLTKRGWQKVHFDGKQKKARLTEAGMAIDLGGVAKGYIVDFTLKRLKENGVEAALVNAGGDLSTFGLKFGTDQFRIGIQDPDNPKAIRGILKLSDCAVATSGDYERYVVVEGKRWHHLLSPATGRPARLSRSATVITSSALVADALATAVFVLGPRQGIALAEKLKHVDASVIAPNGEVTYTSGFAQWLEGESEQ